MNTFRPVMFRSVAYLLLLSGSVAVGAWAQNPFAITGESLVLAGETPGNLMYDQVDPESVVVRSSYLPKKQGGIIYEPARDYILDPVNGTITRTAGSRIPDFSTNILYGKKEFDHNQHPGFGNGAFFVYVDYRTRRHADLFKTTIQKEQLKQTRNRLEAGGAFKVIAYGDSITNGGDASEEKLQFTRRYANWLGEQFPKAQIVFENGATGGDSTIQGLARLQEKVLVGKPDLVLVGFGMNDHNKGCLEPAAFAENLAQIVRAIRENTGAEILLFSAFPPNPDWKYGSHRMDLYAEATKRVAENTGCAFADVYDVWQRALRRKDLPSLLGNNINHPSDFGHWMYYETLKSVVF